MTKKIMVEHYSSDCIIETHQLSKYYTGGKIKALEDVSLKVDQGIIFSLLGPNGAGKTTLIKLLLGIVFPTRGSAKLLGKAISDYTSHTHLGYLAENHRFPDFLTAQQVLFYYGKMAGVHQKILEQKIPELLNLVKLDQWGSTKIHKFSKGMLQRLGIAQALINDPRIIFLDEPTDGIDPIGRREIRDLLKTLRNAGKTVFLNSHMLSEVEMISDQIAILNKGHLVQTGNVEDLISMKQQYQLDLGEHTKEARAICQQMGIDMIPQNKYFLISVVDEQQLNMLIDKLRRQDILIQGIIPHKITLEDFFIDVIEQKEVKEMIS